LWNCDFAGLRCKLFICLHNARLTAVLEAVTISFPCGPHLKCKTEQNKA
jgi:hypothetical protein